MMFKITQTVIWALLVLSPLMARADTDPAIFVERPAAEQINQPTTPAPASFVDQPLTGKPWLLEELSGEPLPGEQAAPYLLFTTSGDLIGFGGCNYFIGKYRTGDAGRIIVSSLRASHLDCSAGPSKPETTLLTSLVMANTLLIADGRMIFFMNDSNLMRFRPAPEISVEELVHQGRLVKAKALKKARHKKKKISAKAKKRHKKTATKIPGKARTVTTKPAKAN